MATKISNVSNLAAFAVEWTEDSGTTFQLINIKGTSNLLFGARHQDKREWTTISVAAPERFLTTPPHNFGEFRVVVDRWFSAEKEV